MIPFMIAVLGSILFWIVYWVVSCVASVTLLRYLAPNIWNYFKIKSHDSFDVTILILYFIFWPIILVVYVPLVILSMVITAAKPILYKFVMFCGTIIPEFELKKKED